MDKIVTFIGFIQNVVTPSRRNRNTNRASSSSGRVFNDSFPKASASFRKDSVDSRFNAANGGLKDTPAGENKMNRSKACAFTEPRLDTLRGEVREIKAVRCGPSTRSPNMGFDDGSSVAVLPPVDVPQSRRTLHDDLSDAVGNASPVKVSSKMEGDLGNKANLPSLDGSRSLSQGKQHQNQTKERKGFIGRKDLTNKANLPDIFSNAGKSFVEVNQLSVFKGMSFRKKPTASEKEETSTTEPASKEEEISPIKGRKSCLKMPVVKLKSKNGKDGGCEESEVCQAAQIKIMEEQTVPAAQGVKICNEENRSYVTKKGESVTMKKGKGGERNPREQRAGTALGRWIMRHGNKVAPAPSDELAVDAEHIPPKEQASVQKPQEIQEHKACSAAISSNANMVSTSPKDEASYDPCETVMVSERNENVSLLVVDKKTQAEGKENKLERVLADGEDEKQGSSMNTLENVETKRDGELTSAALPDNGVTPLSPVNSGLHKETLEDLSLQAVNESNTQKPKVTKRKQFLSEKLDKAEDSILTSTDIGRFSEDSVMYGVKEMGMISELPELPSTKKRLNKISKNLEISEDDSIKLTKTGQHDTKKIDARDLTKKCKQSLKVIRVVPKDCKIQNLTTIKIKREAMDDTGISELRLREPEVERLTKLNIRQEEVSRDKRTDYSQNMDRSIRDLPFIHNFKIQKQVTPEKTSSSGTDCSPSLLYGPAGGFKKLPKEHQQFSALPNSTEGSSVDSSVRKATLNGGKACLPSIKTHKKQMVEDFLAKQKLKQMKQQEMENDFESWGDEDEPEVIKQILERPVTAKMPRYPAHWGPLPNERPPGRGGEGYCLGVIWKNTKASCKSNLSDSSSEDNEDFTHTDLEQYFVQRKANCPRTPKRIQGLFANSRFPKLDTKEEEPSTWCRASRLPRPSPTKVQTSYTVNDMVDIEDVEDFL